MGFGYIVKAVCGRLSELFALALVAQRRAHERNDARI